MNTAKNQEISISLLVEHPENSNFMNAETATKLRRHIEKTGRYEPLTVRPHPFKAGKYQIINGHNRLRVLRALKYETVHCVIWDIDDKQTRLYLATLNRLSGKDIPERRAALIDNLLKDLKIEELCELLPDDNKQLEELKRLSSLELDYERRKVSDADRLSLPVIMTFMLEESEARKVNLALDLVLRNAKDKHSRSHAVLSLASFYIENYNILDRNSKNES